jgi:hypothetical protein
MCKGQGARQGEVREEAQGEGGSTRCPPRSWEVQVSARRHSHRTDALNVKETSNMIAPIQLSSRVGRARVAGFAALCCLALTGMAPVRASAEEFPSPKWTVTAVSTPTNFALGDKTGVDHYQVLITNTGDASSDGSTITIADTLPAGLTLDPAGASGFERLSSASLSCIGLTCTYSGAVPTGDVLTVTIPVDVEATAPSTVTNLIEASGGGAQEASMSTPTTISASSPSWGIAPGSSSFQTALSSSQAGAHADLLTTFNFNTNAESEVFGDLKDTVVDLPDGFAGDPQAAPTCTAAQLASAQCPVESQVGTATIGFSLRPILGPGFGLVYDTSPLYNMAVQPGEVARLGFTDLVVTTNIVVTVRPGDYGLRATGPNLIGAVPIASVAIDTWGIPADHSHDIWRGVDCLTSKPVTIPCKNSINGGPGIESIVPPVPFLSNPTRCTESRLTATLGVDDYEQRGLFESRPTSVGPMTGCERMRFDPAFGVVPTTRNVSSPTGLNVTLNIPQTYGNPGALATPHMKDTRVTLPQGLTLNPSAGAGLSACTPEQFASETATSPTGVGCPDSSELGTVRIHTPVLREEATGHVYLAQPYNNPFKSLLALYLVAKVPLRGVVVKAAGETVPDPVTGQLVTTFSNNPQLPFDEFTLSFLQGQTSPFASPPVCGDYTAKTEMTSWAQPAEVSLLENSFSISAGRDGGACPAGGVPPFAPQAVSGTQNNDAGSYSPFYLRILRQDGEQEITKFTTILPPGLTGNLSGIPFCSDAQIEAARRRSGTQELDEPSCPVASEIGHTLVGAGVGSVLAQTPGKIYLAGPYHGSALSIVSVTSATVGPFDLGTVVIRFALRINSISAQVEVDSTGSDPIPHIIDGIVVHVRDIRVYVNREKFIINPTGCDPMSILNTVTGAGADFTNPADGVPVTLTTPFQAADCSSLAFKPNFKVSTSGKTSRAIGASLAVKLAYPDLPLGTQANIAKVKVDLPKQLPSRLTTLQKACTDTVFNQNPAACPAPSRVGQAKALTPILPVPLEGPAYFVSHGGAKFPELIIVLQGYGFTILLHGETFIDKAGITSSTFRSIPDEPVTSFELTLPQGPDSALAANGNLCKSKLKMPTAFTAQNGMVIHRSTPITATGCPKKRAKKASKHRKKR